MFIDNDSCLRKSRRDLMMLALASATGLVSCATPEPVPEKPIFIEAKGVKDVKGLIAEIKRAAGRRLPSETSDDSYFKVFAQTFVDNAVVAAEYYNVPVPEWILRRLPKRKAIVPLVIAPLITFSVYGVQITMAISTICEIVVYSIVTMTVFIWAVLNGTSGHSQGYLPKGAA